MSAVGLSFHQPTCKFSSVHSFAFANINCPRKPTLRLLRFRSPQGFFSGRLPVFRYNRSLFGAKTMSELIKTGVFRNSDESDERIQTLEQEAFINESSELRKERIEATINRLSKWIVSALFGSVLLLRHDGAAIWSVIGAVSNSMLSVALKRILNQERPTAMLRSDPGMPSSHAQSISYITVFAVLSIVEWLGINEVSLFISGLMLACGSYFTWLRVSQKLHTVSQVVVGAILGSAFSILWYLTWKTIVEEPFGSSLWVQIVVLLGAAVFGLGFVLYVVRKWDRD